MSNFKLSIVSPMNPFGNKIGGAKTFILKLIEHIPANCLVEFWGISSNFNTFSTGRFHDVLIGNKNIKFFPVLHEKDENLKTALPLSLRFTIALCRHVHSFSNSVILFNRIEPAILFKYFRYPKIAIIHNDIYQQLYSTAKEVFWSRLPFFYSALENTIFKSTDKVYTVSNASLLFYKKKYKDFPGKFIFLPTFVDISYFFPEKYDKDTLINNFYSDKERILSKKPWIIFAGRLQRMKAPIRILHSFREYLKKNNSACLIIIGEGNMRSDMERYVINHGLDNNVLFLGRKTTEELRAFYRAADVMLLASHYEGMPMAVLEALACGLPVVSTNVGEISRVITNNHSGEISNSCSPADIADSLSLVLNNPSVYTSYNCVNSILQYTPAKVLKPLFEDIMLLYARINN